MFALARLCTVIAPRELPVGVLTALLGVPMMLWLLRKP
jgi:iron complex transport system permease protein